MNEMLSISPFCLVPYRQAVQPVRLARSKTSSFVVPYGQASHSGDRREQTISVLSWSPDHERHLTFRSQKIDDPIIIVVDKSQETRRPSVKFLARSGDRREQEIKPPSSLSGYNSRRIINF